MKFWRKPDGTCCCGGDVAIFHFGVQTCAFTVNGRTFLATAEVTITLPDLSTVSGFTDDAGEVTLVGGPAGTYHIHIAKGELDPIDYDYEAVVGVNELPNNAFGGKTTTTVTGCGCGLPSASVTVVQTAGPGGYSATVACDGSGVAVVPIPGMAPGNEFDIIRSAPGYVSDTLHLVVTNSTSCSLIHTVNLDLVDNQGEFCFGGNPPQCRGAIPDTVTLTIASGPHAGSHTLNYTGTNTSGSFWEACLVGGPSFYSSTRYRYVVTGNHFPGLPSNVGCATPGGQVQRQGYSPGTTCSGSLSGATAVTHLTAGTAACPIAAQCGSEYTISE